ncbi:type VII secretion-associated serine protease mycosin [Nocardia colli]|uniref:Type VII secretion-associated serine protease mycosin n=1 Tax=Nocardia colli TaxID=2545717 RepID=A0A5N0E0T7_9NOCA|nr:type VII secretion-associated serine protease mycosin [Nocardia colli]KAA8881919.1 type VII secretion-associated serine protease mycosin [Nocardia colli]
MVRARIVAVVCAATVLGIGAVPAGAVEPPRIVAGPAPADSPPGPETPTKQNKGCLASGVLPGSDLARTPPAEIALDLPQARSLSRGAGVTVAVLDTGVAPNSRLPNLRAGGDYVVAGGDGLSDCDAHGTLIAGIIGGSADPADGFSGVAPDAQLISIRVQSGAFTADQPIADAAQQLSADVRILARAITHAAELGAGIITIALPICVPAELGIDQAPLAAALGYAVYGRGALVVAGAGNSNGRGCAQNPGADPTQPLDDRNWTNVKTISAPAWFAPAVLAVGSTTATGVPMPDSLAGPWVSIAAPGTGIESLGPGGGGLINGVGEPDKLVPVGGASFAAAYASGVAALLRSRFPNETPAEITARLQAGAHAPARGIDNTVGAGLIDPMNALSYRTPPAPTAGTRADRPEVLRMPSPSRARDSRPATAAIGVGLGAVLLGLGAMSMGRVFRERR